MWRVSLALVLVALTALSIAPAGSEGVRDLIGYAGGDLWAVYNYTFIIQINTSKGSYGTVGLTYSMRYDLREYNSTHLRFTGTRVGEASIVTSSNDVVLLAILHVWFAQNLSDYLLSFMLRNFDLSVKDSQLSTLSSLTLVPIMQGSEGTCFQLRVGDSYASVQQVMSNGFSSFYECHTGLLVMGMSKSSKPGTVGNETGTITTIISVELTGTNIADKLFTQASGGLNPVEWLPYVALGLAAAAVGVTAYAFILRKRRSPK